MGAKRDCTHQRVQHRHGTEQAYISDRCHCTPCATAALREQKRRKLAKSRGGQLMIPAEQVADHLDWLLSVGYTSAQIARESGVTVQTVSIVRRRQQSQCQAARGRAILAIDGKSPSMRPALPSRRRIDALRALGWSIRSIAREAGLSNTSAMRISSGEWQHVSPETHHAVDAAFDRLSMRIPPETRNGHVKATKARAKTLGLAPPLAWDDIDNPDAQPQGIAKPHQRTIPTREDIAAELEHPAFAGSTRLLADAMGVQPESITRRIQRKDAA